MQRMPLAILSTLIAACVLLIATAAWSESPVPVIRPFVHTETFVHKKNVTPTSKPWVEPPAGQLCDDANDGIEPIAPDALGLLLEGGPNEDEARMVETAIDGCRQTNRRVADPWLVLALLRIEQDMELPRGILSATWCREASMRTEMSRGGPIRGDWRGGHPSSFGSFQLQRWFHDWCGISISQADDLITAARCYASRILVMLPKATTLCHDAAWPMAEAMTANAPRYRWGKGLRNPCLVKSEHWKIWESWQ